MARQGPQPSAGFRVKLVGGNVVRNLQSRRVAFPARLAAAARPRRPKVAFSARAPRLAIAVLTWPPARGPVPASGGATTVTALPRRRRTPTASRTPTITVTAPPRATGTFSARPAATISAASLPRPIWTPACVPGPAAAAVSLIAPPYGPGAPASGL
jgi:hypothetical protein